MIQADNTVLAGAEAMILLTSELGYPVGWMKYRPMLWGCDVAYKIMASNRPLFAKVLFRSDKGPFARP